MQRDCRRAGERKLMSSLNERIQRLMELREKATKGKWSADTHGGCFYIFGPDSAMVADSENEGGFVPPEVVARMRGVGRGATDEEMEATASFIAAAANDAIPLLTECQQRITSLERQLEAINARFPGAVPQAGDVPASAEVIALQTPAPPTVERGVSFQPLLTADEIDEHFECIEKSIYADDRQARQQIESALCSLNIIRGYLHIAANPSKCPTCSGELDSDGYCDPCAERATEDYFTKKGVK